MPARNIRQGFSVFHERITPSRTEQGAASSHKRSIEGRLEQDFNLNQLFYSGSANYGTSIAGHSDVDFFASIPTKNLKQNSAISLRSVKDSLKRRFPRTPIKVDSPAVVLDFGQGDWDTAEVIPADFIRTVNGKNVYDIPDGSGGWMKSSPGTHNAYVGAHNTRLSRKLKPLIRFLKAWKYYQSVPISSFYLELRVTRWMESEKSIVYDIDVLSILRNLESCRLASMQDPKAISGYIQACPSEAKKSDALSRLETALGRATKARDAELRGDTGEAFHWWNKVFAGRFPAFYY